MESRRIPKSGARIPVIGMGTWQTFDVGGGAKARAGLSEVLDIFFAAGGRVIDSSPMYGRAEAVVGDLLKQGGHAGKPFLATKVWTRGRQDGVDEMNRSFRRMGTRTMDLMQVHNLVDTRTHLDTMRAWKAEGRIRYLGITHYRHHAFAEMEALLKTEALDFVQLPYSLADRKAEARLLDVARDTGTAVLVMRPFDGGSLFRRVRGKEVPAFAKDLGIASWGQYFLKWILGHPAVTCPIPATSKPHHMRDNVGAGQGPMPDPEMRRRMARYVG